jgi:hypothetical protein
MGERTEETRPRKLQKQSSTVKTRFTTRPLTFFQEWLSVRLHGQDFDHTPVASSPKANLSRPTILSSQSSTALETSVVRKYRRTETQTESRPIISQPHHREQVAPKRTRRQACPVMLTMEPRPLNDGLTGGQEDVQPCCSCACLNSVCSLLVAQLLNAKDAR